MLTRLQVLEQKIRWQHVAGDQWHAVVEGKATDERTFRFPPTGVHVIVGAEQTQKFAESFATQKVWDLELEPQ